jgi:hypothetical protein
VLVFHVAAEATDHWHRRLLRVCGEPPRRPERRSTHDASLDHLVGAFRADPLMSAH